MTADATPIVSFHNVGVRFGSLVALDAVTLDIQPGSIHCVLGENGAGKSTLMNVLFGLHRPTTGELRVAGRAAQFRSALDARRAGVGMVHQHFRLVPSLTVADNVLLGRERTTLGVVRRNQEREEVRALSERFGLAVDPDARVASLPVGLKQRVEILKALGGGADILILDEPTAVLTPQEIDALFVVVRGLRAQGKTILLVTHKVREVMQLADRLSVLRRGQLVATLPIAEVDPPNVARLMVGRTVSDVLVRPATGTSEIVLDVRQLRVRGERGELVVDDASFTVSQGEIVAVAGVEGNGQTELVEAIAGLRPVEDGTMVLAGQPLDKVDPAARRRRGIAYVPEDRFDRGVARDDTVVANMSAMRLRRHRRHGILDWTALRRWTGEMIERYDIRAAGPMAPVRTLSGGNVQKVILARELEERPRLLLAAQPTRGLDVGATDYVHRALLDARAKGCAVLLVSADLDEVLRVADRIVVILRGRIVSDTPAARATREKIGLDMMGLAHTPVPEAYTAEEAQV